MLRVRVRRNLKTVWKKHRKSRASGTRSAGAVRLLWWNVSHGCNDMHRAARRILPCQASAPCRWTQTIHSGEVRARWWQVLEWRRKISRLERSIFHSRIVFWLIGNQLHRAAKFLEDAGNIVLERMRDAVERHDNVKVNTAFNEFTANDKCAIKSINSKIYWYTDLREWYEQRVIEPTLASLEEWALSRILNLIVNMNKLNPMHAGCHRIAARNYAEEGDNQYEIHGQCVLHMIGDRRFVSRKKNVIRNLSHPHYTSVLVDIKFPMNLQNILKFERLNVMSINVQHRE